MILACAGFGFLVSVGFTDCCVFWLSVGCNIDSRDGWLLCVLFCGFVGFDGFWVIACSVVVLGLCGFGGCRWLCVALRS